LAPSELKLEQWPVDRLIDYARNPRKNDHAVEQMAAVITEFGFRIPVVARSTGEIVDGHLRLKAARRLGLSTVPVVLADELTDAQIKAFRLLANRSATWAEWDDDLLALELEDLKLAEFDLVVDGVRRQPRSMRCWSTIRPTQSRRDGDQPDAADDVPEVPANPVSRSGDVWALGQHRLICGDAADAAVVNTLMAGEQANLLVHQPAVRQPARLHDRRHRRLGSSDAGRLRRCHDRDGGRRTDCWSTSAWSIAKAPWCATGTTGSPGCRARAGASSAGMSGTRA
jgi:hypothetical protein